MQFLDHNCNMTHCNTKIQKWHESPDDRFEVQDDPTCTNVSFSISALSKEDEIYGEKGYRKQSKCHVQ